MSIIHFFVEKSMSYKKKKSVTDCELLIRTIDHSSSLSQDGICTVIKIAWAGTENSRLLQKLQIGPKTCTYWLSSS